MAITYAAGTNSPSNLWQMVQDYTNNTEPTFITYIPSFVKLAEERIYNTVQIPPLRKNSTGTLTLGTPYLTLPTDWTATFSLAIYQTDTSGNTYQTFLLNKDVEYMRQAFPYPSPVEYYGPPTHYGMFDPTTFILGPTPDQAYTVELHYYAYPVSITDPASGGTTWLGNYASNCLLYGSLREAYLYMKGEEDMVKYYEDKYQEGIVLLKDLAEGKDRRDAYRSGQIRIDPQ
jgi:hypothetical protein